MKYRYWRDIGIDYIISIDDIATDIIGIDLLYNIRDDCSYSIPITCNK